MMFHRTKIKIDMCLYIHDHEIKPVSTTKFLGVILVEKLQWSDYINYIKNKTSKALGFIYNNNNNKFFIADNCPYTHIKKNI